MLSLKNSEMCPLSTSNGMNVQMLIQLTEKKSANRKMWLRFFIVPQICSLLGIFT